MTAPDHMSETFKNACMKRGIHTWGLLQTRSGSDANDIVFSMGC